jgi:hypothetical protein
MTSKAFDNEWIFEAFADHPSYFTKRMFGGVAAYVFGRQMLVLVEPTKTGRWSWHGVLVCTDRSRHGRIVAEFPQLDPHPLLKKWLYIESSHAEFERTIERVARAIACNDQRFGVDPAPKAERPAKLRITSKVSMRRGRKRG